MTVEDRNLKPGMVLVATGKHDGRRCDVVEADGGVAFRLDDGQEFASPSAAGSAVTGTACNGWAFWSVEGVEVVRKPRASRKENWEQRRAREVAALGAKGAVPTKKTPSSRNPAATHLCIDCGIDTRTLEHSHTVMGERSACEPICCPCAIGKRGHDCPLAAHERLAAASKKR